MKKIALVTGATSGIGRAIARELAADYALIICGRRKERLEGLRNELALATEVCSLQFDVSDRKAVDHAINSLNDYWRNIHILVNNAGNAHGRAPLYRGDPDDWDAMIDSNLKGLLYVSRAVIPGMVDRKCGDVINISSIAGKQAYKDGNVYCATKFGVDALTKSLRLELVPHGIRVMSVNPGLVETEFSLIRFKGNQEVANGVYAGMNPLTAKDIAEVVKFSVGRPRHVTLADVTVLAGAQADATNVHRNP